MGKKNSKKGSKKNKANKNRVTNTNSNSSNEQQENREQKSSFEDLAEIFLGSTPEQNIGQNTNTTQNITDTSGNNNAGNSSEAKSNDNTSENVSANTDPCCDEIKAKQQELLTNLKNLNDSIAAITLTRDNIASLRIEVLSNIYFTREVRPLIDAVNLIAFASSNMSTVAQNININTFGDKKEIKNAFKLCYKMNDELEYMLDTLTRRIKLYVTQLDNMDRNCPPINFNEDS